MKRIAILISGGGSNMVALVEAMQAGFPARPVLVVSSDPRAGGIARAHGLGLPVTVVDHRGFAGQRRAFEAALLAEITPAAPDILCLAGFMRILSAEFLAALSKPVLNIHPSLLPRYPGLHTHQRALDAGDREAGCSVHLVTPDLDAGPLLGQARVEVRPDDTAESLAARVLAAEHRLYPAVLRRFCEGLAG